MKLDRNINPDGKGKYAIINLRKVSDEEFNELLESRRDKECFALGSECLTIGDEKDGQFFVLKYKDRFAAAALQGYANAVVLYARSLPECDERKSLMEYGDEVANEAQLALRIGTQIPT